MKKINQKYVLKLYALIIGMVCFSSCDLKLQENFEYQSSTREVPVFDMNPLEWLRTFPGDSAFEITLKGIELTNMEEHFSAPNRTYFLLTDGGWQSVFDEPAFSIKPETAEPLDSVTIDDVPVEIIKKVFLYHTIDQFVGQKTISTVDTRFEFPSMLKDDPNNDFMIMYRGNLRFTLFVNQTPDNVVEQIPSGAKGTRIFRNNYLFNNGSIAHLVTSSYLRIAPYDLSDVPN